VGVEDWMVVCALGIPASARDGWTGSVMFAKFAFPHCDRIREIGGAEMLWFAARCLTLTMGDCGALVNVEDVVCDSRRQYERAFARFPTLLFQSHQSPLSDAPCRAEKTTTMYADSGRLLGNCASGRFVKTSKLCVVKPRLPGISGRVRMAGIGFD
jgi:hypothetical protein